MSNFRIKVISFFTAGSTGGLSCRTASSLACCGDSWQRRTPVFVLSEDVAEFAPDIVRRVIPEELTCFMKPFLFVADDEDGGDELLPPVDESPLDFCGAAVGADIGRSSAAVWAEKLHVGDALRGEEALEAKKCIGAIKHASSDQQCTNEPEKGINVFMRVPHR